MEATRRPSAGQGGSVLTMDSVRTLYPPEKYILLLPAVSKTLLDSRPMWALDVSEVKIDPDDNSLVYALKSRKDGGNWVPEVVALTKVALDLISAAAEVQVRTKRVDDRAVPLYAEYEAYAVMNTPSGMVRGQARSAEWDGDLERDKTRLESERYVANAAQKGWTGYKNLSPEATAKAIEDRFAGEWLREREFGKRKAESKAANRALRALLALPSKYDYSDLKQRSFAIAKFVFAPDLDDPQVKMLVVNAGLNAQRQLFGGALATAVGGNLLPAGEAAPAMLALPAGEAPADDDDDDTLDMFEDVSPPAPVAQAAELPPPPAPVPSPAAPPPAADLPTPEEVCEKVATAKALPHLDNVWKKYSRRAQEEGWLDAMTRAYQRRMRELKGGEVR